MVGSDSCGGVLAWPSSRALAGDHHSGEEQLTAPDAPRLAPLEGARQALGPDRAVLAQRLRELHVAGRLGEVQLRVLPAARQLRLVVDCVVDAGTHLSPPRDSFLSTRVLGNTKAADPLIGFRGLEAAGTR